MSESKNKADWKVWVGRVLTGLIVLGLALSGSMKLMHGAEIVGFWTQKFGFSEGSLTPVGLVELTSAVLFAVPQTSVLGAILVTGYLGGAACTHVRAGEPFFTPILMGVVAWGGLFLRYPRLRALLPLVSSDPNA